MRIIYIPLSILQAERVAHKDKLYQKNQRIRR